MRCIYLLLLSIFFFSSCATITNKRYTRIALHTQPDSMKVVLDRNTEATTPVVLQVPRSTRDFSLKVKHDRVSSITTVHIPLYQLNGAWQAHSIPATRNTTAIHNLTPLPVPLLL